ncbi:WD40-repeat-containing domain protein [Flagelloscypha sp. PMI_526]|nr:WD40-repeat-containing domain protein [Flagelloscypha sp. PMI_526]
MARQTQTLPLDYAAQALVAHDDMIAVGGPHSINIFLVSGASITTFASFHLGVQITAIAWGESTSPENDDWSIQLAVATADYNIHVLTKSYTGSSNIVSFGGGLSGHHGRINGLAFCGNRGMEGGRYLASCSEDKVLMIWDLQPNLDMPMVDSPGLPDQAFQPTAYPIPFKHALISVCAHPATSKDLLVADVRGSIYLTDWRTDFTDRTTEAWHHPNVLELVEPHSMAESAMGLPGVTPGSLAWSMDNPDRIGAVFNSKFSLWDLSKLSGGKPNSIGPTSSHGGDRFR